MLGRSLSLFLLLLFSCGKRSHLEGAPRFLPGQITERGDGQEFSLSRQSARTWKDYDGDGLSDRLDHDIDDDGVPNLADQYPFDGKAPVLDHDGDGIQDFIDLSLSDPERGAIQEHVYRTVKVIVLHGGENFSAQEWRALEENLLSLSTELSYEKLKTIVRYSADEQKNLTRADYDPHWLQISFYPTSDHDGNLSAFTTSLVHELGHVHAAENPALFQEFQRQFATWISPSAYGATSPDEGYAEDFLFRLTQSERKVGLKAPLP